MRWGGAGPHGASKTAGRLSRLVQVRWQITEARGTIYEGILGTAWRSPG